MTVGGHHPEAVGSDLKLGSIQKVPAIISGDGEAGLVNHLPQNTARNDIGRLFRWLGQRRKVHLRQPDHLEIGLSTGYGGPEVLEFLDLDLRLGHGADDLEELLGRQG